MRTNINQLSKIIALKKKPWRKEKKLQQFRPPRSTNKFKKIWGFLYVTSLEKLCNRLLELQGQIKIMVLLKLFSE